MWANIHTKPKQGIAFQEIKHIGIPVDNDDDAEGKAGAKQLMVLADSLSLNINRPMQKVPTDPSALQECVGVKEKMELS